MRPIRGRMTVVVALASLGSLALPGIALGAHPTAGALYTGNSGKCAPSINRECVFKFRVSSDKRTLRYVKKGIAISDWMCQAGGGEAIFGPGKNDYRIPLARIRANGNFSGSDGSGSRLLRITGSFTSRKRATLKFVLPNQHCHTPQLILHKH